MNFNFVSVVSRLLAHNSWKDIHDWYMIIRSIQSLLNHFFHLNPFRVDKANPLHEKSGKLSVVNRTMVDEEHLNNLVVPSYGG